MKFDIPSIDTHRGRLQPLNPSHSAAMFTLWSSPEVCTLGFNSLRVVSDFAYHLHPHWWGRGLMTEASDAALSWLWHQSPSREAEAFIESDNLPSIALAERLGFHATDTLSEGARRWLKSKP